MAFRLPKTQFFNTLPHAVAIPVALCFPNAATINIFPHAMVTTGHRIDLLLLHYCNSATILSHNVNI